MSDIKHMDIAEFRSEGYLQELNRQFLHPLGLALEVVIDEGEERLGGVWDYRADAEGIFYAGELADNLHEAAEHIAELRSERDAARKKQLGFVIQPAEISP